MAMTDRSALSRRRKQSGKREWHTLKWRGKEYVRSGQNAEEIKCSENKKQQVAEALQR
jgi:hypothetical protein